MKPFIHFSYAKKIVLLQVIVSFLVACSSGERISKSKRTDHHPFVSGLYSHFEGGYLFTDINAGLDILWQASFKNGNTYKENLAYFVEAGLLILPNTHNSNCTARLSALPITVNDNKLFVKFQGTYLKVLAIIHTHPEVCSLRKPAPVKDFQFCYLGIHNYVMGHRDLFDSYKDSKGYETFVRLGARGDYDKIPLLNVDHKIYLTFQETTKNQPIYEKQ